jgi:serine/threonine protein kinase
LDYFDAITNDKYCNSSNGEKLEYVYESFRQMLNGLKTLHAMGILHRDIKPENFLVKQPSIPNGLPIIKIADFGFSCFEKNLENICKGRLGTPAFVAPHIYLDEDDPVWSVMDDLYALANVVYAGLTCISFMDNDYIKELVQDYYNGNLSKEDILDFYENNYRNKIKDLYNQYQEQKLSTKQKPIFNFFWIFLGILDPKNKYFYSADGLLNTIAFM